MFSPGREPAVVSSEFAVGQRSVFASTLLSARVSALAGAPPPHAKLVCPAAQCLYERLHLWKEQTPNPTPDKVKSLYNAQQQFLVVQGQDKDLGTGSAIGVWGLCYPLQFQGLDDPSCVCLSFQLLCFVGFWSLKWTNMAVLALTLQNVRIQSFSSTDLLSI